MHVVQEPEDPQVAQLEAVVEDVQHAFPTQNDDAHALLALQVAPAARRDDVTHVLPLIA